MSNFPTPKLTNAKVTAPDQSFVALAEPIDLPEQWHYEETVAEVEAILAKIEGGELDLADVFTNFSTAVEYLRQCEAFLSDRQKQVDLLIETLTDEPEF
jgi:exodeoxyribonuclease VII small subunit